ncbi:hypothetical protein GCM10008931_42930 [Oceanobacillus oncorhynchi subsp. oncorhynchi]|uniref:hypothetical protein n=1 Tax=Oceanobacillus oncorhynchi TaxID=545501 RepID=UPI0031DA15D1
MPKENDDKKQCVTCLKYKNRKSGFFISFNKWHSDGLQPYCKDCMKKFHDENNVATIKELMRLVDKPYIHERYEKAKESKKETLGEYLRMLNLNQKHATYADSVFENGDKQGVRENHNGDIERGFRPEDVEDVQFTKEEMEYLIDFWGRGYSKEDYEYLQKEYESLTNAYETDSSYAMEVLFQEAAQVRLSIQKNRENGKPVDKELKTFQDLLASANVKPVQETGANSVEQNTFGTLIKKYENEDPVPEPLEEWKDVDGIKRYVQVWFLGHLCRMLGIKNKYSEIYEEEVEKHTVRPPDSGDD